METIHFHQQTAADAMQTETFQSYLRQVNQERLQHMDPAQRRRVQSAGVFAVKMTDMLFLLMDLGRKDRASKDVHIPPKFQYVPGANVWVVQ